jgi:hypothetical protein
MIDIEVTSGPKTGVASSPDTKKSIHRGRPAADVNKGKSLKKMTIVEFLRIKTCDLDNHQVGLEHPTCHATECGLAGDILSCSTP